MRLSKELKFGVSFASGSKLNLVCRLVSCQTATLWCCRPFHLIGKTV